MKKSALVKLVEEAITKKLKEDIHDKKENSPRSKLHNKVVPYDFKPKIIFDRVYILENSEGAIMEVFLNYENAMEYKLFANNKYYKNCKITNTDKNLKHWLTKCIDVSSKFYE